VPPKLDVDSNLMSMSEVVRKMFEEVFVNAQAIIDWVEAGNGESETLEYKVDPASSKKHSLDADPPHKLLAREATAFANAGGGIIIWGVDQKQGEAPTVQLLEDAENFKNTLIQKTADVSSPPIVGLKHESYLVEGKKGFVATYVPQSNDRPHMAGSTEGRYYVRSGESAVRMGHNQVRDAMMAKSAPTLVLERSTLFIERIGGSLKEKRHLEFRVKNIGQVSARNLLLYIRSSFGQFEIFSTSPTTTVQNNYTSQTATAIRWTDSTLHPFETKFGIYVGPDDKTKGIYQQIFLDVGLFADDFSEFYRIPLVPDNISTYRDVSESRFVEVEPCGKGRDEIIRNFTRRQLVE
jgi:hypothetical protein